MYQRVKSIESEVAEKLQEAFASIPQRPDIQTARGDSWDAIIRTMSPNGLITISYSTGRIQERTYLTDVIQRNIIVTVMHKDSRDSLYEWLEIIHAALNRWKPPSASSQLLFDVDKIGARIQESESHIAEVLYQCTTK
ncbi:MAG: hypothetical protein JNL32_06820 [Candidatus Kapabacteria bacterium]|nr:hypothetical protein [Candidatus Kapabacteria bacterium]